MTSGTPIASACFLSNPALKAIRAPSIKSMPKIMTYTALTTGPGTAIKAARNFDKNATAIVIRPKNTPTLAAATPIMPMYEAVADHGAATGGIPSNPQMKVLAAVTLRPP